MNRRHFLLSSIRAHSRSGVSRSAGPLNSTDAEATGGPTIAVLLVDTDRVTAPIDRRIYGHFLEHINQSVVDGLFGEQIQGCGFEGEDLPAAERWRRRTTRGR